MAATSHPISLASHWGRPTTHTLQVQAPAAEMLVVLFPGKNYSCDRPLLHYARFVALAQGCDALSLTYGFQAAGVDLARTSPWAAASRPRSPRRCQPKP